MSFVLGNWQHWSGTSRASGRKLSSIQVGIDNEKIRASVQSGQALFAGVVKFMKLENLKGESVSGIAFVQDYVELHFDGPIFRCLTGPILHDEKGFIRFSEVGSRDRLCSLINDRISGIEADDQKIDIRFASGKYLVVQEDENSPEFAHFIHPGHSPLQVW